MSTCLHQARSESFPFSKDTIMGCRLRRWRSWDVHIGSGQRWRQQHIQQNKGPIGVLYHCQRRVRGKISDYIEEDDEARFGGSQRYAKWIWSYKIMCIQYLRRGFERVSMKESEWVNVLAVKLTSIINEMQALKSKLLKKYYWTLVTNFYRSLALLNCG